MQRGARGSHPGAPARLGRRHRQDRELAVRPTLVAVRWCRQGKKEEEQRWLTHGARWSAKERKKKGEAGGLCWATELGC
jgi:hypothetical protein